MAESLLDRYIQEGSRPRYLEEGPPPSLYRRLARAGAEASSGLRGLLESVHPAARPAAFIPWFLLNLQNVPEALERIADFGTRRRYSSPLEVLQGAPTERTFAGDLAQVAFGAQGVQPTASLARGAVRLPLQALNRAVEGPGPLAGQVGAVKLPGGEWDAGTVSKVVTALREGTGMDYEVALRIARNYLNKHLGTEKDPAKNLMVPSAELGEPARRWEDITDEIISSGPRGMRTASHGELGRAPLYQVDLSRYGAPYLDNPVKADQYLKSERDFYENVRQAGKYLDRVPPEKRSQYDFPRAMRELSQERTQAEREAERLRLAAQEGLPVHRSYSDDFRWVEIAPPARLTPEQRLSLREHPGNPDTDTPRSFEALDPKGKPIWDNYNERPAVGDTPEEAWLSGKLAQEGNDISNCVGGYCKDIMRGESRVFSLRDPKGHSIVTVEMGPPAVHPELSATEWHVKNVVGPRGELDQFMATIREMPQGGLQELERKLARSPGYQGYLSDLAEAAKKGPWEVTQIRGHGDKPVMKRYQKYVEDFLKTVPRKGEEPEGWRADD